MNIYQVVLALYHHLQSLHYLASMMEKQTDRRIYIHIHCVIQQLSRIYSLAMDVQTRCGSCQEGHTALHSYCIPWQLDRHHGTQPDGHEV